MELNPVWDSLTIINTFNLIGQIKTLIYRLLFVHTWSVSVRIQEDIV